MIDLLNMNYFALCTFVILSNVFMLWLWKKPILHELRGVYDGVQKIHTGSTPRFGGVILYLSLWLYIVSNEDNNTLMMSEVLILILPMVVVTFLEDVFNNIQPRARMLSIILSALMLIFIENFQLPVINITGLMDFFIAYPLTLSLLLIVCLAALANGFNMIDGANGLLLSSALSILTCLYLLANGVGDGMILSFTVLMTIILFSQMLFNYPFGKMFMGDLGAYGLGLIIGFYTIVFFGRHADELMSWFVVLILFYPIFEVIFSMVRRLCSQKIVTQADDHHLHQLIFKCLNRNCSPLMANNLIVLILIPLWAFPLVWIMIQGVEMNFITLAKGIIINGAIYCAYYFLFKKVTLGS
jgi:UDP-GlcNAc:undecaprenyl-phosphate GlcNAc-1-phosphate transferase